MHILVHCTDYQQRELNLQPSEGAKITYSSNLTEDIGKNAEVVIDLLYEQSQMIQWSFDNQLVIVNSVIETLEETNPSFIRFNGWPGFLQSSLLEASGPIKRRKEAEVVLQAIGKKLEWLPDEPGFITARAVSMIINEAYFALEEGVSSKEQIDTAMRLGTAYPYGPFEWAEKIGKEKIVRLLSRLQVSAPRYEPAPLLIKEAHVK